MTKFHIACAAAAAMLLAGPAFADSMSGGNQMSSGNQMMSSPMKKTCHDMMDEANGMMGHMTDQMKKDTAMGHMNMAKSMMDKHDEPGCKKEAQAAMDAMK